MKTLLLKLIQRLPHGWMLVYGGQSCIPNFDYYAEYKFNGWFSIIMWLNSFGRNSWVISTYNSYEWINTKEGFFKFPFVWECKRNGDKHWTIEPVDLSNPNQVRYHSPLDF